MLVLGRQQAGVAVQRVPVAASRRRCRRWPSATSSSASSRRIAVARRRTARSSSATPRSIQPMPSSVGVTRSWSVNAEPAVAPLDVDERQAGLDAQHHQRLLAERADAVAATRVEDRVEHVDRVLGLDRDLEAEVAGVAGAGQRHRCASRSWSGSSPKNGSASASGISAASTVARARALDGEDAVVVGDVLELDAQPAAQVAEPAEVRARRGQQEVVSECRNTTPSSITKPRSSHHSVYCAWPGRQRRMSRTSTPARNRSASGPWMRYLNRGEVSKTPTRCGPRSTRASARGCSAAPTGGPASACRGPGCSAR